jgi:hypothetical protein
LVVVECVGPVLLHVFPRRHARGDQAVPGTGRPQRLHRGSGSLSRLCVRSDLPGPVSRSASPTGPRVLNTYPPTSSSILQRTESVICAAAGKRTGLSAASFLRRWSASMMKQLFACLTVLTVCALSCHGIRVAEAGTAVPAALGDAGEASLHQQLALSNRTPDGSRSGMPISKQGTALVSRRAGFSHMSEDAHPVQGLAPQKSQSADSAAPPAGTKVPEDSTD